jgi:hypothetical protein
VTYGIFLFLTGILIMSADAGEYVYGKKMTCGSDVLCQSIEGEEFNMILFSEFGSELAVIYDRSKVGKIDIVISGSPYREEIGTVLDAVRFLSKISEYRTFTVSKARKSVGWFGAERIEGMYIVRPIYSDHYLNDAAKYVIRDRRGELELRIKPVYSFGRD